MTVMRKVKLRTLDAEFSLNLLTWMMTQLTRPNADDKHGKGMLDKMAYITGGKMSWMLYGSMSKSTDRQKASNIICELIAMMKGRMFFLRAGCLLEKITVTMLEKQ